LFNSQAINWEIIEPDLPKIPGIVLHDTFFDDEFASSHVNEYEAIVQSHCFEHMYDPIGLLGNCNKILQPGGKMIFSVPNMREMLRRKYTNCLNFKHTFFLPKALIDYLPEISSFDISEKVFYRNDHSIFYSCTKQGTPQPRGSAVEGITMIGREQYRHSRRLFDDYIGYHQRLIRRINRRLDCLAEEASVYLFGAHVFSQFLIFNGLNISKVKYVLDNSPIKIGKRLYGTSLYVKDPVEITLDEKPVVILKAGPYDDEIRTDILNNKNPRTSFI